MFDVAIIGAGPAGSTLARLLADDFRILLVEGRRPGDEKCCGGLLAPDAQRELADMDLGVPQCVLAGPQLFAVRAVDLPSGLVRRYQRHYISVDRSRLDQWLLWLVPPRADIRLGTRAVGMEREPSGLRLTLSRDGRESCESARVVVMACGASSRLLRRLGRPPARLYAAVQECHAGAKLPPCYWALFDPEVTDFYSWMIPKDGMLLVGTAVPVGTRPAARLELLKRRLGQWGFSLGRPVHRCGALMHRPAGGQIRLEAGGALLVGEAAGWISPSSGEGISYALASAAVLARAIRQCPADPLPRYRDLSRPLRLKLRLKAAKSAILCRPTIRRLIMRCGIGSIPEPAQRFVLPTDEEPVPYPHGRGWL